MYFNFMYVVEVDAILTALYVGISVPGFVLGIHTVLHRVLGRVVLDHLRENKQ